LHREFIVPEKRFYSTIYYLIIIATYSFAFYVAINTYIKYYKIQICFKKNIPKYTLEIQNLPGLREFIKLNYNVTIECCSLYIFSIVLGIAPYILFFKNYPIGFFFLIIGFIFLSITILIYNKTRRAIKESINNFKINQLNLLNENSSGLQNMGEFNTYIEFIEKLTFLEVSLFKSRSERSFIYYLGALFFPAISIILMLITIPPFFYIFIISLIIVILAIISIAYLFTKGK